MFAVEHAIKQHQTNMASVQGHSSEITPQNTEENSNRNMAEEGADRQLFNEKLEALRKLLSPQLYEATKDQVQLTGPNQITLKFLQVLIDDRTKGSSKIKAECIIAANTYGTHKRIIKLINVDDTADPADCDVVIVFCPVCSRAASDVKYAMAKIPEPSRMKPVILLLMHHTSNKDFPTNMTDWTEYNNIKLHVDILFHQTKNGLLICDKNRKAIEKIKNALVHSQHQESSV